MIYTKNLRYSLLNSVELMRINFKLAAVMRREALNQRWNVTAKINDKTFRKKKT